MALFFLFSVITLLHYLTTWCIMDLNPEKIAMAEPLPPTDYHMAMTS